MLMGPFRRDCAPNLTSAPPALHPRLNKLSSIRDGQDMSRLSLPALKAHIPIRVRVMDCFLGFIHDYSLVY
jgi:hypothetical protein